LVQSAGRLKQEGAQRGGGDGRHPASTTALAQFRSPLANLPPNLSPIGTQDEVSYKPKEMIHAMAIDKQKALHLSGKPVLAT
jgi:hypothetical protein